MCDDDEEQDKGKTLDYKISWIPPSQDQVKKFFICRLTMLTYALIFVQTLGDEYIDIGEIENLQALEIKIANWNYRTKFSLFGVTRWGLYVRKGSFYFGINLSHPLLRDYGATKSINYKCTEKTEGKSLRLSKLFLVLGQSVLDNVKKNDKIRKKYPVLAKKDKVKIFENPNVYDECRKELQPFRNALELGILNIKVNKHAVSSYIKKGTWDAIEPSKYSNMKYKLRDNLNKTEAPVLPTVPTVPALPTTPQPTSNNKITIPVNIIYIIYTSPRYQKCDTILEKCGVKMKG